MFRIANTFFLIGLIFVRNLDVAQSFENDTQNDIQKYYEKNIIKIIIMAMLDYIATRIIGLIM